MAVVPVVVVVGEVAVVEVANHELLDSAMSMRPYCSK